MNIKKIFCSAAVCCLLSNTAFAATIPAEVFTKKAEESGLDADNYKTTDIIGNEVKGVRVKKGTGKFPGVTSFSIICTNDLDRSELAIVLETNPHDNNAPVPKTLVINDSGKRVDIPISNYERKGSPASIVGPWAQYNFSVPLKELQSAGVKTIMGISVITTNPVSGIDGDFEIILKNKQERIVKKTNDVYTFYLKISGAQNEAAK